MSGTREAWLATKLDREKTIKFLQQLWEVRYPWETTIPFPVPEDG